MKKSVYLLFVFVLTTANGFSETVDEYLSIAEEYYNENKFEEVRAVLEEARGLYPDHALLNLVSGNIYYRLGNIPLALEYISRAIELDASLVNAYSLRFTIFFKALHAYDKALENINMAIQLDAENYALYVNRGRLFWQAFANSVLAVDDYNRAIEIISSQYILKEKESFDFEFNNYEYVLSLILKERGIVYFEVGNHEYALGDLNEAVNLNGENTEILNHRGIILFGLGRHDEAFEDFNTAIRLDSNDFYGYDNRGVANLNLGRLHEALADFTTAITIDPNVKKIYQFRSVTYLLLAEQADSPTQAAYYLDCARIDEAAANRLDGQSQ